MVNLAEPRDSCGPRNNPEARRFGPAPAGAVIHPVMHAEMGNPAFAGLPVADL